MATPKLPQSSPSQQQPDNAAEFLIQATERFARAAAKLRILRDQSLTNAEALRRCAMIDAAAIAESQIHFPREWNPTLYDSMVESTAAEIAEVL